MSVEVVAAVLLYAILVAGATISLNETHGNITKRAILPPPPPVETVDHKLCEGHRLSQLFFVSEAEAGEQSTFTSQELSAHGGGWKLDNAVLADPETLTSMLGFLEGVRGVENLMSKNLERIFFEDRARGIRWRDATYSQSHHYGREGRSYEPTHAYVRALTSGGCRVLAIVNYESPEDAIANAMSGTVLSPAQLPQFQRLSDIAFALYCRKKGSSICKPPSWFLLKGLGHSTRYREDLGIIRWCLLTHNLELQSWPGITFPIGTPCFYAIMATYPSNEIAAMLISHKRAFLAASLASVTVFAEGDSVSLLWFGGDLESEMLQQAEERNKVYVTDNLGGTAFPAPLNPRKAWQDFQPRRPAKLPAVGGQ